MSLPTRDLAVRSHTWGSDAEFFGPRHEYRESLMLRILLPHLTDRCDVLDAGCGAGSFALKLCDAGCKVTAVDASASFAAETARRLGAVSCRADVRQCTLEDLPFADRSFCAISCGEVLEHLPDDRASLQELFRVLQPQGTLLVTVPSNPARYDWVDRWAGHYRRYSEHALADLLREVGFTEIEVLSWGFPFTGLYERTVYRRLLRRRIAKGAAVDFASASGWSRRLQVALRAIFEVDTLFLGRRAGYFGLMATARRPPDL